MPFASTRIYPANAADPEFIYWPMAGKRIWGRSERARAALWAYPHMGPPLKELYQDSVLQPESWRVSRAQGILGMLILQYLPNPFPPTGTQFNNQRGACVENPAVSAVWSLWQSGMPLSSPLQDIQRSSRLFSLRDGEPTAGAHVALTVLWLLKLSDASNLSRASVSPAELSRLGKSLE